jgi:hypothetical protein
VLDGDTRIPTEVLAEDHGAFQALVSKELDLLRLNNEGTLAQLQLQAGDVQDWLRSEGGGAAPRERLS